MRTALVAAVCIIAAAAVGFVAGTGLAPADEGLSGRVARGEIASKPAASVAVGPAAPAMKPKRVPTASSGGGSSSSKKSGGSSSSGESSSGESSGGSSSGSSSGGSSSGGSSSGGSSGAKKPPAKPITGGGEF